MVTPPDQPEPDDRGRDSPVLLQDVEAWQRIHAGACACVRVCVRVSVCVFMRMYAALQSFVRVGRGPPHTHTPPTHSHCRLGDSG